MRANAMLRRFLVPAASGVLALAASAEAHVKAWTERSTVSE
jgi:hypothetical protein